MMLTKNVNSAKHTYDKAPEGITNTKLAHFGGSLFNLFVRSSTTDLLKIPQHMICSAHLEGRFNRMIIPRLAITHPLREILQITRKMLSVRHEMRVQRQHDRLGMLVVESLDDALDHVNRGDRGKEKLVPARLGVRYRREKRGQQMAWA